MRQPEYEKRKKVLAKWQKEKQRKRLERALKWRKAMREGVAEEYMGQEVANAAMLLRQNHQNQDR